MGCRALRILLISLSLNNRRRPCVITDKEKGEIGIMERSASKNRTEIKHCVSEMDFRSACYEDYVTLGQDSNINSGYLEGSYSKKGHDSIRIHWVSNTSKAASYVTLKNKSYKSSFLSRAYLLFRIHYCSAFTS